MDLLKSPKFSWAIITILVALAVSILITALFSNFNNAPFATLFFPITISTVLTSVGAVWIVVTIIEREGLR